MNQPLVSVILVTYNSEKYLDNCLKSVFKNKYSNFETIIVDNNSSDNTQSIIKEYKKKYPTKIKAIFY